MVKERGVADKEAGISMRSWGWFAYKKRDAVRCPVCGRVIIPSGPAGTFDFPNVGIVVASMLGGYEVHFIDVEVKAGDTSVAFNELDIEKRTWAKSTKERPKYLWICIGRGLRDKKKPRKTYLLPLALFYELERNLSRKSIPYGHAALAPYELKWKGKGIWELYGDFYPFTGEAHE